MKLGEEIDYAIPEGMKLKLWNGEDLVRITVQRRSGDFMAYLNGDKAFWDCSVYTPFGAIDIVLRTHCYKSLVDNFKIL